MIAERAQREQLLNVFLRNFAGAIDLVGIHVLAQILFQIGEKFLASLAILGALLRPGINPIEIVTPDKKIAREAAALVQRIARGLGKLERFALAFGHLRGVDDAGRRGLFHFRGRFLSPATAGFFGCFQRRFHKSSASLWLAEQPNASGTLALHSLLIKICPITRMFLQYFACSKFLFSSGQPFQFLDGLLYSKMFRKSQWPAAEWRKAGS